MRANRRTIRTLRILGLSALLLQLTWHAWDLAPAGLADRAGRPKLPDFLQFYTFGQLLARGYADALYDPAAHAGVARELSPALALSLQPNYSPFIAALLVPLAQLPYTTALAVFVGIAAVLYGFAAGALVWSARALRRDPLTATLLLAAWPALFIALRYGQISPLTLVLFTAAVLCHARGASLVAGIALGLAIYKPQLLLTPGLALLLAGQSRLLAGTAIGAAAELVIATSVVGVEGMGRYLEAILEQAGSPALVQAYPAELHSIRGQLRIWGISGALLDMLTWAAVPCAAWAAARTWRNTHDLRVRWSALVLAAVLASPHLLTYDLLLLAVPLVLLTDWLLAMHSTIPAGAWRWGLALMYAGAWPGTLIARLYHVQISTIGMLLTLWLLWKAAPPSSRS